MINIAHSISLAKACFLSPNIIDLELAKDVFATKAALAQIQTAIESGQITPQEVLKRISDMGELQ